MSADPQDAFNGGSGRDNGLRTGDDSRNGDAQPGGSGGGDASKDRGDERFRPKFMMEGEVSTEGESAVDERVLLEGSNPAAPNSPRHRAERGNGETSAVQTEPDVPAHPSDRDGLEPDVVPEHGEATEPEEDHWPFAPPMTPPVITPPHWGGSTYPRPTPTAAQGLPGASEGYLGAGGPPHVGHGDPSELNMRAAGVLRPVPGNRSSMIGIERYPYHAARNGDFPLSQPLYGASFTQALRRFIAKRSRFVGFASPSEFWWVQLAQGIVWTLVLTAAAWLNDPSLGSDPGVEPNETVMRIIGLVVIVLIGVTAMPNLTLLTRRLHDAGLPGALGWIILIPGLGWLGLFICLLLPSRAPEQRNPEWEDRRGD